MIGSFLLTRIRSDCAILIGETIPGVIGTRLGRSAFLTSLELLDESVSPFQDGPR
jgi:hypothetical protein